MKNFLRKLLGQKIINYYHLGEAIIANLFYDFPSRQLHVIAVTGTDGKTTTVNLIVSILKNAGFAVSFLSSINAQIGQQEFDTGLHTTTPSPFLLQQLLSQMVKAGSKYAVLEVTSHALDQYRTWGIRFETAVLTNITHEHLDYHKTFEEYVKAKMKLFENVEYRILNIEDSTSLQLSPSSGEKVSLRLPSPRDGEGSRERLMTYGLTSKAQIWANEIKEDLKKISFTVHIQGLQSTPSLSPQVDFTLPPSPGVGRVPKGGEVEPVTPHPPFGHLLPQGEKGKMKNLLHGGEIRVVLNLPGRFNVLNALAAISVALSYQIPPSAIVAGLESVKQIPGRMEYIDEGQDFLAMVDFAHTPNALENLLSFLRSKVSGKLIIVFGAAGKRDQSKRPKMGEVAARFADVVVITREDNRSERVETICGEIASGIKDKLLNRDYFIIPDRREAIRFALQKARQGDLVAATGKGHEQSLNIDGQELPWDDRKVMREELRALRNTNTPTLSPPIPSA